MVPSPGCTSSITTDALPSLTPSTKFASTKVPNDVPGRNLLTPEDAIFQGSPPRKQPVNSNKIHHDLRMTNNNGEFPKLHRRRHKDGHRGSGRRQKGTWKKLLWVKQSYPDNYTDQETFLEHLQRNPRLQPYDFWPLVADSTVIVQHVCSVIIFVVCFAGICQERVPSVTVVGGGSIATFLGWLLWDWWVGQDELQSPSPIFPPDPTITSASTPNLGTTSHKLVPRPLQHPHSSSTSSLHSAEPTAASSLNAQTQPPTPRSEPLLPPRNDKSRFLGPRASMRVSTAKSALLIYFTLLGLSPILKSLTRSTSSDSIWAMSFLLFTINIFFFDYGTPAPTFTQNSASRNIPASLSTNAALMASTVLASRLPSTGQVFSLTLFSIEVFGLFPVFRRYARQRSWRGHVVLTTLLVLGAGGGVGLILGRGGDGEGIWDFPYKSGIMGTVIGILVAGLAMGGCSWWLIGLQKYKNEIHGPWDAARPIIRRRWD